MEMRARRDLFVVIFLCCFLLLTGYFHSQGILMAAATMLAVLTLVASMLTMQFRQEEIAGSPAAALRHGAAAAGDSGRGRAVRAVSAPERAAVGPARRRL